MKTSINLKKTSPVYYPGTKISVDPFTKKISVDSSDGNSKLLGDERDRVLNSYFGFDLNSIPKP